MCASALALLLLLRSRRADAFRFLCVTRQATQFGAAIATICDKEGNEGARTCGVGSVADASALASADHQSCAGENGDVGGQRIVRTSNGLGESAGRKSVGLLPQ